MGNQSGAQFAIYRSGSDSQHFRHIRSFNIDGEPQTLQKLRFLPGDDSYELSNSVPAFSVNADAATGILVTIAEP